MYVHNHMVDLPVHVFYNTFTTLLQARVPAHPHTPFLSDLAVDAPGELRLHHHQHNTEYPHRQGAVVQALPPQKQCPPANQPPADVVGPPVPVVVVIGFVLWAGLRAASGARAGALSSWQQAFCLTRILTMFGLLVVLLGVVVLAGYYYLWKTLAVLHLHRNVTRLALTLTVDIPDFSG